MVRADAAHLAACVWDDSDVGFRAPKIEVDIWGCDCLNMESPGLEPLTINPLILQPLIIFHLSAPGAISMGSNKD